MKADAAMPKCNQSAKDHKWKVNHWPKKLRAAHVNDHFIAQNAVEKPFDPRDPDTCVGKAR